MTAWPSVGVVIPTRNRPEQLRQAIASVLAQDYQGQIQVVVVFDGTPADQALADGDRVLVVANDRTPGLAGARNCGILATQCEFVAFCDDDDRWRPGKLGAQIAAMRASAGAEFSSCGIVVHFEGRSTDRLAGTVQVTHQDLIRSRMVMVHSSTYLASRAALVDGIGLVDETIPGGQNEDWDLALRAAARQPIVNVDQPLVEVAWGSGSHYETQWLTKAQGLLWMLEHHGDLVKDQAGAARVYAQLAFAYACLGDRSASYRWIGKALRRNWLEPRVPFAAAVAAGVVSGDRVLRTLHARGRGI
ncbi:MAG TPA: glycosyltransferase family 2 protein [Streptosporangiaceae bacterium]